MIATLQHGRRSAKFLMLYLCIFMFMAAFMLRDVIFYTFLLRTYGAQMMVFIMLFRGGSLILSAFCSQFFLKKYRLTTGLKYTLLIAIVLTLAAGMAIEFQAGWVVVGIYILFFAIDRIFIDALAIIFSRVFGAADYSVLYPRLETAYGFGVLAGSLLAAGLGANLQTILIVCGFTFVSYLILVIFRELYKRELFVYHSFRIPDVPNIYFDYAAVMTAQQGFSNTKSRGLIFIILDQVKNIYRHPLLKRAVVMSMLGCVVMLSLSRFIFDSFTTRVISPQSLSNYLALVFFISSFLEIVVNLFFSKWIIRQIGFSRTNISLGLILFSLLLVLNTFAGMLMNTASLWVVTLLLIVINTFFPLVVSTSFLIYNFAPKSEQDRIRVVGGITVLFLSLVSGSIFTIFLFQIFALEHIVLLTCGLCLVYVIVSYRFHRFIQKWMGAILKKKRDPALSAVLAFLASKRDTRFLPDLYRSYESSSLALKQHIIETIGKIGTVDILPFLKAKFSRETGNLQTSILKILLRFRSEQLFLLKDLIEQPYPEALLHLFAAHIGKKGNVVLPPLKKYLASTQPDQIRKSLLILRYLPNDRLLSTILALIDHRDFQVRKEVLLLLHTKGQRYARQTEQALQQLLIKRHPASKRIIIELIAALKYEHLIWYLLEHIDLSATDDQLKSLALWALWQVSPSLASHYFVFYLSHTGLDVAPYRDAFARLTPQERQGVIRLILQYPLALIERTIEHLSQQKNIFHEELHQLSLVKKAARLKFEHEKKRLSRLSAKRASA